MSTEVLAMTRQNGDPEASVKRTLAEVSKGIVDALRAVHLRDYLAVL